MPDFFSSAKSLTHQGAMAMLDAAIAKADEIGQPQCIVIVDASGEVLGEIRMSGSKFLSRQSALAKALTAASIGAELGGAGTGQIGYRCRDRWMCNGSSGGLPIAVDGEFVGGIGVGSGTGEQDVAAAQAALSAIGADGI